MELADEIKNIGFNIWLSKQGLVTVAHLPCIQAWGLLCYVRSDAEKIEGELPSHQLDSMMFVSFFVFGFVASLSVCLLVCLFFFLCFFVCLLACLLVCLFLSLFACLFVCLFVIYGGEFGCVYSSGKSRFRVGSLLCCALWQ